MTEDCQLPLVPADLETAQRQLRQARTDLAAVRTDLAGVRTGLAEAQQALTRARQQLTDRTGGAAARRDERHALLADPLYKTFFVHTDAMAVLERMFTHTRAVCDTYGAASGEYTEQAESLARCLTAVFTYPGFGRTMTIHRDGHLSLLCHEHQAYVFGVIFFPDRRGDGAEVQPGTWSLHS
jgi:hypothetical protein